MLLSLPLPHNGARRDSRGCALSHKRIAHGRGSVPEVVPEFDPTPRESPGGKEVNYARVRLGLGWGRAGGVVPG